MIDGIIDKVTRRVVSGWARHRDGHNAVLPDLELRLTDGLILRRPKPYERRDLGGPYGFEFTLPEKYIGLDWPIFAARFDGVYARDGERFVSLALFKTVLAGDGATSAAPLSNVERGLVCAITDTMTPGFYFDLWYRYYSEQIGAENLHVLYLGSDVEAMKKYNLGSLINLPNVAYDNDQRAKFNSGIASSFCNYYENVIFCDTDEFVIPNPHKYDGIIDFCSKSSGDYFTAIGMDVFQMPSEKSLMFSDKMLGVQRKYGQFNSPMCKTVLTRQPITWTKGFHSCSYYPNFGELYLFHLKRADLEIRIAWSAFAKGVSFASDANAKYHSREADAIREDYAKVSRLPRITGPESLFDRGATYAEQVRQSVSFRPESQTFGVPAHMYDKAIVEIPSIFGERL